MAMRIRKRDLTDYAAFLASKTVVAESAGFEVDASAISQVLYDLNEG